MVSTQQEPEVIDVELEKPDQSQGEATSTHTHTAPLIHEPIPISALPDPDGPEPWEHWPNESSRAWNAFTIYRDMGPGERSTAKVAKQLGKCTRVIHEWSSKYKWVIRSRAWDTECDRISRRAEVDELRKMRKRHINMSTALQRLGALELKKLIEIAEKVDASGKPGPPTLNADQVLRLIEVGIKIERLNRGEPEQLIDPKHTDPEALDVVRRLADLPDKEFKQIEVTFTHALLENLGR